MGIETIAMLAFNVIGAMGQMKSAKAEAKATIAEGNIATKNKAKEIAQRTGAATVSFLNSGLTLEGTPQNAINSIFNTGLEDLGQISSNYNAKAKSQISAGRTAAISSLASGFGGMSFGGTNTPMVGSGSWLDQKVTGFNMGGTNLGNDMPWLK